MNYKVNNSREFTEIPKNWKIDCENLRNESQIPNTVFWRIFCVIFCHFIIWIHGSRCWRNLASLCKKILTKAIQQDFVVLRHFDGKNDISVFVCYQNWKQTFIWQWFFEWLNQIIKKWYFTKWCEIDNDGATFQSKNSQS